ncbi:MAG TPA: hypothetical protein VFJ02_21055 [Vicinamibacterales bacterium]|nr:hypothetical protein [Vicinamibacterales bacterium]
MDAPVDVIWTKVRHGALAQGWPIRALFAVRSILMRGGGAAPDVRVDEMRSSQERPGFQVLGEDRPREFAVGAIGKVWRLEIPFVHVADASAFAAFAEPGFVKVAWAVRITPLAGGNACDVAIEVRVAATDPASRRKFHRYFRVIGPFSRYIRRALLRALARNRVAPLEDFPSELAS